MERRRKRDKQINLKRKKEEEKKKS